jgi:predicted RNase H-like HicB family nuclease
MKYVPIIEEGENGWLVGQIAEVPAVISQGKTINELMANLSDALRLILEQDLPSLSNNSSRQVS